MLSVVTVYSHCSHQPHNLPPPCRLSKMCKHFVWELSKIIWNNNKTVNYDMSEKVQCTAPSTAENLLKLGGGGREMVMGGESGVGENGVGESGVGENGVGESGVAERFVGGKVGDTHGRGLMESYVRNGKWGIGDGIWDMEGDGVSLEIKGNGVWSDMEQRQMIIRKKGTISLLKPW